METREDGFADENRSAPDAQPEATALYNFRWNLFAGSSR
jgi:hypothetical protein